MTRNLLSFPLALLSLGLFAASAVDASSHKANLHPSARHTNAASARKTANTPPFKNNHFVLSGTMNMNGYHSEDPTVVIVDKGSHSTYVLQLQQDRIVRVVTVSNAIGSKDTPTPFGRYTVLRKENFPKWIPPRSIDKKQKTVAPYNQTHTNPLGVAAIFLDRDQLALHGTNDPSAIRTSSSHGCIRHSNADISRLFGMVKKGDTVIIIREFRGFVMNKSDFKSRRSKA